MLAAWCNLLPVFIVRRLALRYGERMQLGPAVLRCGTKDVYFCERAAATKEPQQ